MIKESEFKDKNDQELVLLTLENQRYFLGIIQRYETKLHNYIRRISSSSEQDAQDILQEVFLKVYLNLNDFDADLKFSSWIYRIAHNQVISQYRKKQARPQTDLLDMESIAFKTIRTELNIEKDIDIQFLKKNIFNILDKMNYKYKEIIILKYFEEKSYKEISDIIKKPMGTVASLMSKAKVEFKKEVNRKNIKL